MKLLFLKIALLYFSVSFIGQNPNSFIIGEEDLKGVEIYSLCFHENLLFAATNNGLYKQEGNGFKSIPFKGNPVSSLFELKEDNLGKLFCKTLSGQIYQLENDSLILFYELSKTNNADNFYYFFDKENNLIITGDTIYKVLSNGNVLNLTKSILTDSINKAPYTFYSHTTAKGDIFISSGFNDIYSFIYSNGVLNTIQSNFDGKDQLLGGHFYLYDKDSSQFILCQNGCYYSPTKSISAVSKKENESYFLLKNGDLLARDGKVGIRVLGIENDTLIERFSLLNNHFISSVTQGKNKTLFLGTFGEGIIVVPNYEQIVQEVGYNLTGIANNKKELIFSSREGVLLSYSGLLKKIDSLPIKIEHVFYSTIPYELPLQKKNNVLYYKKGNLYGALKDICVVNDSSILFVDNQAIGLLVNRPLDRQILNLSILGVTDSAYHYKDSIFERYIAISSLNIDSAIYTSTGRSVVNKSTGLELTFKGNSITANDLVQSENHLIIGTKNNGLFFYEKEVFGFELNTKGGLYSNTIIKLKLINDTLFIQSKKGIQVYNIATKELFNLNNSHGVSSLEVKDFDLKDQDLWVMEKNKFYNVPFNLVFTPKEVLSFSVDSIYRNNVAFEFKHDNSFSSDQNKLKVRVVFDDIVKKQDAYYTYFLKGFDQKEQVIKAINNEIIYDYLPSGEYTLSITLHYNNTKSKTFIYLFKIALPFYQTWWFIASISFVALVLFYIIFRARVVQLKRKSLEELEKEILSKNLLDSELKALRSQMNPHFMFNSLNSIQNLILKEDIEKSYDYIVMFSELVRSTLNYSEQEFISVEKELKFLEVYLGLEKLRFKEDFAYKIISNVPSHIQVPSILIQPFIENALKHGLLHKTGEKLLNVELIFNEKLVCIVKDNGVGRTKALEIKSNKKNIHNSFAMESITKRLKILSERYGDVFSYEVKDIYEDGVAKGTEVYLVMPFKKIE